MLMQRDFSGGPAVRVHPTGGGYRGAVPPALAFRRLLARSLASLGLSGVQTGQLLNLAPSSVCNLVMPDEPEAEPELPPEVPPVIEPPAPYRRPAVVEVSAKFIRQLREDYDRGGDGRSARIGRLDDVQEWLDSLSPGKQAPRAAR